MFITVKGVPNETKVRSLKTEGRSSFIVSFLSVFGKTWTSFTAVFFFFPNTCVLCLCSLKEFLSLIFKCQKDRYSPNIILTHLGNFKLDAAMHSGSRVFSC